MLFAKVALGLPIPTTFDYLIPTSLEKKAAAGTRVWVPFRNKKLLGYIVEVSRHTKIHKVKPVYDIIDEVPILNNKTLVFTRKLAEYYLCSWGEAIETALPDFLRRGKPVKISPAAQSKAPRKNSPKTILLHYLDQNKAWDFYIDAIKAQTACGNKIIFLSPQIQLAMNARDILRSALNTEPVLLHSREGTKENASLWCKIINNESQLVVGTRLALFAPLDNVGLIIIDSESDPSFKQDQKPHYHIRDAAFMRAEIEGADIILGALSPSCEAMQMAKGKEIEYLFMGRESIPEVTTIDTRMLGGYKKQKSPISYQLQSEITQALQAKEKILVFINRRGFATFASCPNCHKVLRCPRCDVNLAYHFAQNSLVCHYCNYKMAPPNVCPDCNASYIRYSGIGTEKIESELSRIYPAAMIARTDNKAQSIEKFDILVSSRPALQEKGGSFDLTAVVSADNSLNRVDFRAAEKTFALLMELLALTGKKLIIQTNIPHHYCFQALREKNIVLFYDEELKFRKQLALPPFSHMILIKVRGKNSGKVKLEYAALLERLNLRNKNKQIKIIPVIQEQEKLRGNYFANILVKSKNIKKALAFLNKEIYNFRHSDIIVTTDVDPL